VLEICAEGVGGSRSEVVTKQNVTKQNVKKVKHTDNWCLIGLTVNFQPARSDLSEETLETLLIKNFVFHREEHGNDRGMTSETISIFMVDYKATHPEDSQTHRLWWVPYRRWAAGLKKLPDAQSQSSTRMPKSS
jgi:hypothetical protein